MWPYIGRCWLPTWLPRLDRQCGAGDKTVALDGANAGVSGDLVFGSIWQHSRGEGL
jgi:hypothetical protein